MPHIKLLPFKEYPRAADVFGRAVSPEGTIAWFETLALTTLAQGELALLAIIEDERGQVHAALPLVRDASGSLRSLTSPYTTLFGPAFCQPEWAHHLGYGLGCTVTNVLRLDAMDAADPGTSALLAGLERSKLACARFRHFPNWFGNTRPFGIYWSRRPAKLRSTVRRKMVALSKKASVEFQCHRDVRGLESALMDYLEVYGSSWKSAEPHPEFIPTLVRRLGANGTLRLTTLAADGVIIAAQIWLLLGTKATIFKLGHRQEAAQYSPGTLLTHWTLEMLCREEEIQEVDFGRGDDAYKQDWLSDVRQRQGIIAVNWKSRIGIGAIFYEILRMRISSWIPR